MHYIIGTEIYIPEQRAMKSTGPQPINAQQVTKKAKGVGPFQPGIAYQLHNIRMNNESNSLCYTFNTSAGEQLVTEFSSVEEAEKYISMARDEPLPDKSNVNIGSVRRMI
jgi:hypothetical protein